MSDYFPFEIQAEIMKWLPVKSLIQFRSVSKTWKSHIDSSDFIAGYSGYQIQQQDIVVSYEHPNYVLIADDHTFPQHRVSLTVPLLVNMFEDYCTIGSSHGLLCLIGHYYDRSGDGDRTVMAVLWNLSIRRAIPVVVEMGMIFASVVGFGVCPKTIDPKIVKITYIKSESDIESIASIPWQVEVFTLSTGVWRCPYTSNLPRKSIEFDWFHVAVDGFLYWRAIDRITMGGECYLIMSFDLTSEEFREVKLPDNIAREYWSMSKLRESLVVLQHGVETVFQVICVWMMEEDGAAKSFIKLFNINVGTVYEAYIMGFRNSGEPFILILEAHHPSYKLVVYDPYSKTVDNLGIDGKCVVSPYMQTLLLLDQPNFEVYNEMETIKLLDDLVFS